MITGPGPQRQAIPHRWIGPWMALPLLLSAGVLLGSWLLPGGRSSQPAGKIADITAVSTDTMPPESPGEDDPLAETKAKFAAIRKQARAARKTPDIAALAAIFDAGGDDALRNAINKLNPEQCFSVLRQLLSSNQAQASLPPGMRGDLMESLLKQDVPGRSENIARRLLELGNHLPDPGEANELAEQALVSWGRTDPLAAANFGMTIAPDAFTPQTPLAEICRGWAGSDFPAALAWAKSLPDADARKVHALNAIYFSDNTHLDEAEACLQQLMGMNEAASWLAASVASAMAGRHGSDGPPEAAQWALSLSGVPERRVALEAVIDGWMGASADNRSQVQSWAAALPEDEARAAAWVRVLGYLALFDPAGQPLGSPDEYLDRVKANAAVVDAWINDLPPGVDRDKVISVRERDYTHRPGIWR